MRDAGSAPLRISLLHRILHLSYSRGAEASHFCNRRVTPIGWVLMSVLLLTAVLGADVARSSLYQLFALTLAILSVSMLWAWARRARVHVSRDVPRFATVGEECAYQVTVTNEGWRALRGFDLVERPPDPRPNLRVFAFTREPGEEERNLFDRFFIYYRFRWLMERRRFFSNGRVERIGALQEGESLRVTLRLIPRRRGVIQLNDLRVRLPDPLGLFRRCRKAHNQSDTLVVLPRRYRLPNLSLPGEACFQLGGEAVSNTIGQSGEFLGLRDYRSGDALRHIHWKGWARTGTPIVKEFEDVYFPRYGLVLDNFADHGDEELFEEAVSVAASFAAAIDTRRNLLDLMFIKDEAIMVHAGRGEARAEKLLEVLAAVEVEPQEHLEALERLVLRHRDQLTACICVFTGWSERRDAFLRRLVSSGLETLALVVSRNAQALQAQVEQKPLPCRHLLLDPSNVQDELFKL